MQTRLVFQNTLMKKIELKNWVLNDLNKKYNIEDMVKGRCYILCYWCN